MKIYKGVWLAVAFSVTCAASAQEESLLEYVTQACQSDLDAYCSQVTPGEGRLLHCVAAHEDKISGQCGYALYQAASLLEQLTMAIAYMAESCGEEINSMCSDVEMGEGRVLTCLEDNQEALGQACSAALRDTVGQ